ncbi:hypothetical protein VTI74DRAFT_8930 [Chaetomium olivicolor]
MVGVCRGRQSCRRSHDFPPIRLPAQSLFYAFACQHRCPPRTARYPPPVACQRGPEQLVAQPPIAHICKELQQDKGCQEISRCGLQCMLEIFNSRLSRSRAITFKLLDSLATLLRRSGGYHAGLEIITELLKSSPSVFGTESDQVRCVENEVAPSTC